MRRGIYMQRVYTDFTAQETVSHQFAPIPVELHLQEALEKIAL